jgi:hypothetical protein
MMDTWNKCDICGRFIALDEFGKGIAIRNLVTPDAYGFSETYETYHDLCKKSEEELKQGQDQWWNSLNQDQDWIELNLN